jgi:hypothetical protein
LKQGFEDFRNSLRLRVVWVVVEQVQQVLSLSSGELWGPSFGFFD